MLKTETIKLYPTGYQSGLIKAAMNDYILAVNETVAKAVSGICIKNHSSKDITANLPSAVKGQVCRDARSVISKYYKNCHNTVLRNRKLAKYGKFVTAPNLPVLRKPVCFWNNQNFKLMENGCITFPVMINGKSTRIIVKTSLTDKQKDILSGTHLGTMRIVCKNGKLVSQVTYEAYENKNVSGGNVMGIDLGIKCPAVSYCTDGSVKFYGNGRKNKYMRRHYAYLRKKLQKSKKMTALERINNKEQRIMKDLDHKLSREIVENAVSRNVSVIKLESLGNIRKKTRNSRKNNHSLHSWSFYRLAQFIEYKAKLAGISVEYVNPAYTSQRCPVCGSVHHADDRNYTCACGFHIHRDLLGAMNICNSTEFVGNRQTA